MTVTLSPQQQAKAISKIESRMSRPVMNSNQVGWQNRGNVNTSPTNGQTGFTSTGSNQSFGSLQRKISKLQYRLAEQQVQIDYLLSSGFVGG